MLIRVKVSKMLLGEEWIGNDLPVTRGMLHKYGLTEHRDQVISFLKQCGYKIKEVRDEFIASK